MTNEQKIKLIENIKVVAKNKNILLNNDYIASVGECFEFVDPVFEIWFRQYSF